MTDRERILCAFSGAIPDRIAWVPRLEFWYRGRKHTNTLPIEFKGLTLPQIINKLNVGWYANIPDWTDFDYEGGDLDFPLGILRSKSCPYDTILEGVERHVTFLGRETIVEYITPIGSILTTTVLTEEMRQAGVSTPYITRHAIMDPKDIDVVGYIFSHIKIIPALDGYISLRDYIGDKGIAVAFSSAGACPIHHIMRSLMPMEKFFFAMMENPGKIFWLAEQMENYYRMIEELAANSLAEVIIHGGNYDDSITYPPFFQEYILPHLRNYARTLHNRGKYLMTHTDGENQYLLPLYLEAEIDGADSLCPAPMTKCNFDEIRGIFADKITIWGGIPSVLLCPHSCNWEDFKHFIDDLLIRYYHESHFILGVSDMVTADADIDRLKYITDRVYEIK